MGLRSALNIDNSVDNYGHIYYVCPQILEQLRTRHVDDLRSWIFPDDTLRLQSNQAPRFGNRRNVRFHRYNYFLLYPRTKNHTFRTQKEIPRVIIYFDYIAPHRMK